MQEPPVGTGPSGPPISDGAYALSDVLSAEELAVLGLSEPPFAEDVSDVYFFPSDQHLRALAFIGQLFWSRASVAVIAGETGIGKSLLLRRLQGDLDERVLLAHVRSDAADPQIFLSQVLEQFGIELAAGDRTDRRRLLQRFLVHQFSQNRLCVLAVEGVQALRPAVLEELRQIAQWAVEGKRVVKLLLLGTTALNRVIDSPRMADLSDTQMARFNIETFSEDQVAAYVAHRLRAAGAVDADALAPPTLMPMLHRYSAGVPRAINRLCDHAMAAAVAMGDVRLGEKSLRQAATVLNALLPEPEPDMDSQHTSTGQHEQQAILMVSAQGHPDSVIHLAGTRLLIGRSELADLRIDSAFVSRYHALIVREPLVREPSLNQTMPSSCRDLLIDLGSTNALLVNGKRVVRAVLKHRDLIQVGPARVTYLNTAVAPPMEKDPSQTASFVRPGSAEGEADQTVLAFGRFNDAG
jgi:general secretion pathway protein A